MSEVPDWPLAERRRPLLQEPRRSSVKRRPLPRAAWALAAAAFLAGLAVSAAAFSMGWRSQAKTNESAQTQLAVARAHEQRLGATLARTRTELAAARAAKAAAAKSAQAVSRDASTLASALVSTGKSAESVSLGAASVGTNVDRLASELKTLTTYLTTTPTSQLDAGFVATQTAYLTKQLGLLQSARSDLGAAVADFDSAAKRLSDRAAKLSGSD